MKSYKTLTDDSTPEDLVSQAISELQEVHEEIDQWRSNMEGTNLENSEKYSMLETACSELSDIQEPTPDEWPHAESRVTYSYMTPKRKTRGPSRAVRISNATGMIASLVDFYEGLDDAEEHSDLIQELREIAEKDIELPGMYG